MLVFFAVDVLLLVEQGVLPAVEFLPLPAGPLLGVADPLLPGSEGLSGLVDLFPLSCDTFLFLNDVVVGEGAGLFGVETPVPGGGGCQLLGVLVRVLRSDPVAGAGQLLAGVTAGGVGGLLGGQPGFDSALFDIGGCQAGWEDIGPGFGGAFGADPRGRGRWAGVRCDRAPL